MLRRVSKFQVFGRVAKASPKIFAAEYLFTAMDGITLALLAFATERLFAGVFAVPGGQGGMGKAVAAVLLVIFLHILSEVCSGMSNYLGEVYYNLSTQKLYGEVNERLGRISNIAFEKPEILDRINGAYAGVVYARSAVNTIMDIVLFYLPYFVIYGIFLYRLRPLLLLAIPSIFIPMLLTQLLKSRVFARQEEEAAPLRRRAQTYASYLTDKVYAKETRTLGAVGYFWKRYEKVRRSLGLLDRKARTQACGMDICAKVLNMTGYGGVLYLLIDSVFAGYIGVSAFSAVLLTVGNMVDMADEIIASRAGELSENLGKMRHYIDFLSLELLEERGEETGIIRGIHLERVCFAYPTEEGKDVLQDITMDIRDGETLALVGENGGGKTTLTKLLLGLYEPTGGVISWNGKTGDKVSALDFQRHNSAVFQNFSRYYMTLRENVGLKDTDNVGEEKITEALERAGVELSGESFPEGLDTMLSREFGGVELSGGQWQRVAIARGLLKECSLLIMDEPTAAIDPLRESELYHTFLEAAKGKVAVIVTHRLGVARFCDRIAVMKEGKLVALGPHEQLLQDCAYYRMLWEGQVSGYETEQTFKDFSSP